MTPAAGRYTLVITPTARRGTYRVIYRIDDAGQAVTVVDVAHPRGAYRGSR